MGSQEITRNDPLSTEYVVVFADSKEDYTGSLVDYAKDCANRMRDRLKSPEVEVPGSITMKSEKSKVKGTERASQG
jgi:hypothetical protein